MRVITFVTMMPHSGSILRVVLDLILGAILDMILEGIALLLPLDFLVLSCLHAVVLFDFFDGISENYGGGDCCHGFDVNLVFMVIDLS